MGKTILVSVSHFSRIFNLTLKCTWLEWQYSPFVQQFFIVCSSLRLIFTLASHFLWVAVLHPEENKITTRDDRLNGMKCQSSDKSLHFSITVKSDVAAYLCRRSPRCQCFADRRCTDASSWRPFLWRREALPSPTVSTHKTTHGKFNNQVGHPIPLQVLQPALRKQWTNAHLKILRKPTST